MYINYSNKIYELNYSYLGDKKIITTYHESKTDETFVSVFDYYAKDFEETDPNIQDIYDVKFYVKWDSKLENVITKWRIQIGDYGSNGTVSLYHEGHLPEWRIVEKGISQKCIAANQVEGYSVEFTYIVKDGKKLDEPLIEERDVTRGEFEEIIETYRSSNI